MKKKDLEKLLNSCNYKSEPYNKNSILYFKNNATEKDNVCRQEFLLYEKVGYFSWIEFWDGEEGNAFTIDFDYENLIEKDGRVYIDDMYTLDVTPSYIDEI